MKYRQKSIPLLKIKLITHPLLSKFAKSDAVRLKANRSFKELPIEVIQTLIDLNPLKCTFLF